MRYIDTKPTQCDVCGSWVMDYDVEWDTEVVYTMGSATVEHITACYVRCYTCARLMQ